ncbi:uncharacterized protein [Watersipora subatra]|uniref:uncharacterized protein n=1 Tax=Watersipora subatra TaxID=2589382 RepID=UPI00355B9F5B
MSEAAPPPEAPSADVNALDREIKASENSAPDGQGEGQSEAEGGTEGGDEGTARNAQGDTDETVDENANKNSRGNSAENVSEDPDEDKGEKDDSPPAGIWEEVQDFVDEILDQARNHFVGKAGYAAVVKMDILSGNLMKGGKERVRTIIHLLASTVVYRLTQPLKRYVPNRFDVVDLIRVMTATVNVNFHDSLSYKFFLFRCFLE